MVIVATLLLSLASTAPQALDLPTQVELRPRLIGAMSRIQLHNDWRRVDLDERWNRSSPTFVAVDGTAIVQDPQARDASYVSLPVFLLRKQRVTALEVTVSGPEDEPFVVTELRVLASPTHSAPVMARRVRIELEGTARQIRLAEVRLHGEGIRSSRLMPSQSSLLGDGHLDWSDGRLVENEKATRAAATRTARIALDGVKHAPRNLAVARTAVEQDPWWEVDLGSMTPMRSVEVFGDPLEPHALHGFRVVFYDDAGEVAWRSHPTPAPRAADRRSVETGPMCWQPLAIVAHSASTFAPEHELSRAIVPNLGSGWAPARGVGGGTALIEIPSTGIAPKRLRVELYQEQGGGRVVKSFGARVSTARDLAASIPPSTQRLFWDEPRPPWSEDERRQVARFLDAIENHFDLWTLTDAELLARARTAPDDLPAELQHLESNEVLAITPAERVDLIHGLTAGR